MMDFKIRDEFLVAPPKKSNKGSAPQSIYSRFMRHVDVVEGACWKWNGSKLQGGYGHFLIGSRSDGTRRFITAHRMMLTMIHGDLSEDKDACHTCDNPECVNPSHLFVGTRSDNIQDCISKERFRSTSGYRLKSVEGQKHHNSKLTDEQAAAVFLDARSLAEIASDYNIAKSTVFRIKSGQRRRNSIADHFAGAGI